jgi:hypothetical protein
MEFIRNHKDLAKVSIFFLRFLKSIDWYGFSYGFLIVLDCFINVLFKVITNVPLVSLCSTCQREKV